MCDKIIKDGGRTLEWNTWKQIDLHESDTREIKSECITLQWIHPVMFSSLWPSVSQNQGSAELLIDN